MGKEEYIDVGNTSKSWNFGVYPSLLESSLASFSDRPLRQAGALIPVIERSFASAICSLAAFQIEGMLQKLSLDQGGGTGLEEILKLVKSTERRTAIRELSIVRDAIAHGHVYKTTILLDDNGLRKGLNNQKLTKRPSDKAKQNVINNKTKKLKLNVNPGRISFPDAVLSIALVNVIYRELENRTVDMPINRFIVGSGYDTDCPNYFGDYIQHILKDLDKSHKQSVNNKLRVINSI